MTDTDTTTTPETQTPVKHTLTAPSPDVPDLPPPAPEPVDYFATYDSLKAGETLQLLKALGVTESELAVTGTPQLVAVVWKHLRSSIGVAKVSDLLDMTTQELLSALHMSNEEYVRQVNAYIAAGSKS